MSEGPSRRSSKRLPATRPGARRGNARNKAQIAGAAPRSIGTSDIFGQIPDPQDVRDEELDGLAVNYYVSEEDESEDDEEDEREDKSEEASDRAAGAGRSARAPRRPSGSPELAPLAVSPPVGSSKNQPIPQRRDTATSAASSVNSVSASYARSPFQTSLQLTSGDVVWEVEQVILPEPQDQVSVRGDAAEEEEEEDEDDQVKNVTWADGYDYSSTTTSESEESEDEDVRDRTSMSSSLPRGAQFPQRGHSRRTSSSISRSPIFRVTGVIVAPSQPDIVETISEKEGEEDLEAGVDIGEAEPGEESPLLGAIEVLEAEEEPDYEDQDFVLDEDIRLHIFGYNQRLWRLVLYWLGVVLTGGLLFILTHWFPTLRLRLTAILVPFRKATHVLITDNWGGETIEVVQQVPFDGMLSDVWPDSADTTDLPLPFLTTFVHRTHRFIFNPATSLFETTEGWRDPEWSSVLQASNGLVSAVAALRAKVFGINSVAPPEPSVLKILYNEVLNPFYLFQFFSIVLWLSDSYQLFATAIAIISVVGILGTLIETRSTMKRIRELSSWNADCWVLRAGKWIQIETKQLLPGDVVEVPPPNPNWFPADATGGVDRIHPHDTGVLPADCVLLTGEAIVTESMLTGESIPVTKSGVSDEELAALDLLNTEPTTAQAMQRWFLFAGTKVVRVKAPVNPIWTSVERLPVSPNEGLLALVVRTGFSTTKGALTRSILYPKPSRFSFYEDSMKFIFGMTIVAILGFAASLYNFIRLGVSVSLMIRRALDLITVVVPPALPATMGIGAQLALSRLRRYHIFCTSPPRINVAGKLDAWVFDKTGTLTGESLEVLGVRAVSETNGSAEDFTELYRQDPPTDYSSPSIAAPNSTTMTLLMEAMATCHGIKVVSVSSPDKLGELTSVPVGDPMDLQMFSWTGFEIEEGGSVYSPRGGSNNNRPPSKDQPGMGDLVPMVVRPPGQSRLDWSGIAGTAEHGTPEDGEKHEIAIDVDGAEPKSPVVAAAGTIKPTELGVVRTLEFSSALRRMTVVVRRVEGEVQDGIVAGVKASPQMECFVKGAPEVLLDICREDSVPPNYTDLLREYTHKGYRVIAVAWKILPPMPFHRMLRTDRAAIECDLRFLGFIVFENKMKPSTPGVIATLREARMRQMMCTGDNLLTAISVSKECGIVPAGAKVFVPRFIKGAGDDWARQSAAGSEDGSDEDDRSTKSEAPLVYGGHTKDARLIWEDVDAEIEEAERGVVYDDDEDEEEEGDDDEEEDGEDGEEGEEEEPAAAGSGGGRRVIVLDPHSFRPLVLHAVSSSKNAKPRRRGSLPPAYATSDPGGDATSNGGVAQSAGDNTSSAPSRRARRRIKRTPSRTTTNPTDLADYAIAVTGDVFEWMMAFAPRDVSHRMLAKTRIYARFSPDQKQALVERLQSMHYSVGFCGDGANDVGALKSADVGISLSEAEASVAAPFTSRNMELDCVLRVVQEGRAALVTSFACFKYMAIYSIVQFVTVTMLYPLRANLGDFQYLWIDLFIILPIAIFMGWSEAAETIHPKNPTSNLLSKKVLTSLAGQALLMGAFQVLAFLWVRRQAFYLPPGEMEPPGQRRRLKAWDGGEEDDDDDVIYCYEDTVLFLLSNFQYVVGAVVFSIGRPFRKGMHTNVPFLLTVAILTAVNTLMILATPDEEPFLASFLQMMQIVPMPWVARIQLLGLALINCVLAVFSERYVWPVVAGWIGRATKSDEKKEAGKIWKGVEKEMRIG